MVRLAIRDDSLEKLSDKLIDERLYLSEIENNYYKPRRPLVAAAQKKIKRAFSDETPEERLLAAIVLKAVEDLARPALAKKAYHFLSKKCWPLDYTDCEPDWIVRIIKTLKLIPDIPPDLKSAKLVVRETLQAISRAKWRIKRYEQSN